MVKEKIISIYNDEELDLEDFSPPNIKIVNNHIYFYNEIFRDSAIELSQSLMKLYYDLIHNSIDTGLIKPTINLHLNSPGGELFSAFSVLRTIEEIKRGTEPYKIPADIYTYIDGESSSGCSLISIAGTKRYMDNYSYVLIHNAVSEAGGKLQDFEDHIANTSMLVDKMKEIYIKYTKLSDTDLTEMLKHNKYLSAQDCLKFGIVDEIIS